MQLSISARIFVGFMVVLLAFGGVIGYNLHSSSQLRQDLRLISESYHPLEVILVELRTRRDNLLSTIQGPGQTATDNQRAGLLKKQFQALRLWRARRIKKALALVRKGLAMKPGPTDIQTLATAERQMTAIKRSFLANEPLFDKLLISGSRQQKTATRETLLRLESKLDDRIHELIRSLKKARKSASDKIEAEEEQDRLNILVMMGVAIIVSLSVTYGAQRTLRPLKTLVAGTKRLGSGDYEHRVAVDSRNELGLLGDEFNNMARAIEVREQRLIRSERMAAVGQISSHITHEVRNPLSSISLNTELLEDEIGNLGDAEADEARNLCAAISKEVDRLTDITEEYLRFARLPKPRLEPECINDILQNLVSFIHGELAESRVEIAEELQDGPLTVDADENQLRQAFLNLLRNAREAMSDGGGTITISTRQQAGQVVVRIADTGVGIEKENLAQVFEPFFSTKDSGTGLGLALTHQIIQEHGGALDVESTPGQGTTFIVNIPAAAGREILERPEVAS